MAATDALRKETDFVFPSLKAEGRVPLSPAVVCCRPSPASGHEGGRADCRRASASAFTTCGTRFSNWLVNKAKVEPKTVQSILRHSRIQTTLDLYTQGDGDETRAAQGAFLKELGMRSEMMQ